MSLPAALFLDARSELGECPRWHAQERRLYWVDIARNSLHRRHIDTGAEDRRVFAQSVGCFAFRAQGGLVLGMKDGFALLDDWDSEPEPFGPQTLSGRPDLRLNDGRTDPAGRFWAGAMDVEKKAHDAALYRVDAEGSIHTVAGGMLTCNGAAFDMAGERFYHADTASHALRCYDFDSAAGTLSNERIFHQWPHGRGRPDGGSVDQEGYYWTALFDGGRVERLSPEGEVVLQVALPVSRPTMIAFGGDDLRTAFVTSARTGLSAEALAAEPLAGGIFTFPVEVPGVPEWPFAG